MCTRAKVLVVLREALNSMFRVLFLAFSGPISGPILRRIDAGLSMASLSIIVLLDLAWHLHLLSLKNTARRRPPPIRHGHHHHYDDDVYRARQAAQPVCVRSLPFLRARTHNLWVEEGTTSTHFFG